MNLLGRTVHVRGEVSASADLTVEGTVDGPIWCEGHAITIGDRAIVTGDVVAQDITVSGRVTGTLLAREVVDIRETASVSGRIVSGRLILHEGARFNGEVRPQQVDAALTVARHRRKEAEAGLPTAR
ncbi:MAG: polymer-forming cytoskeletal protein [Vicinamibacterales bacterium]